MKNTAFKVGSMAMASLLISLTACKKDEAVNPAKPSKSPAAETEKNKIYDEGIRSNDGYPGVGSSTLYEGYYAFAAPFPGQQPINNYTISTNCGNRSVAGCAATTGSYVYAYKDNAGVQYIEGPFGVSFAIFDATGSNIFSPVIEEIEINPQAPNEIYALVSEGNAKRFYKIDANTATATLVTVNGNANAFNNVAYNGYKSGSITFVPAGTGYELVFTNESTVYSGTVSWHFAASGTNNVNSVVANHHTYPTIPGTGNINTTYGNGKLYFARDAGTLYSLSLATGVNTVTNEGITVTNKNDFAYYKAY